MDHFHESLHVRNRGLLVNPVPQVEDIARPPGPRFQNLEDAFLEPCRLLKQRKWIQVALNRFVGSVRIERWAPTGPPFSWCTRWRVKLGSSHAKAKTRCLGARLRVFRYLGVDC